MAEWPPPASRAVSSLMVTVLARLQRHLRQQRRLLRPQDQCRSQQCRLSPACPLCRWPLRKEVINDNSLRPKACCSPVDVLGLRPEAPRRQLAGSELVARQLWACPRRLATVLGLLPQLEVAFAWRNQVPLQYGRWFHHGKGGARVRARSWYTPQKPVGRVWAPLPAVRPAAALQPAARVPVSSNGRCPCVLGRDRVCLPTQWKWRWNGRQPQL